MRKLSTEELRAKKGKVEDLKNKPRNGVFLVLDNIRSTYNVGAMFRTADAAGIEAIYLCGITAQPPRKEIDKVALGTVEHMPWKYFEKTTDAVKELKSRGVQIVALEQTDQSVDYLKFDYKRPVAIIVGYEVDGVSQDVLDLCDAAVDIPMSGFTNSLNVATAAGIILFRLVGPN